jgi:CelD/BcsL family acetyltransferase involved in cellulose biosynthesis
MVDRMTAPCTVDVITTSAELEELEPVWDCLVNKSSLTHPFMTHEWISSWWECFGEKDGLCVLVVRAGSEPIAIAPLMRKSERVYGRQVATLQLPANDHTNRGDVIIAERPRDAYDAIWDFLSSDAVPWDMVVLRELPDDSPTLDELTRRAERTGILSGRWQSEFTPYVPMATSWDHYEEALPAKHRANLRNRLKRLSALGRVELETVSGGPTLSADLEEGFRIEEASWKGRAGTAIRCQPVLSRFYTQFAEKAAKRGWLRLQFLKVGDRRIAFTYCVVYQNRMYLIRPGFDSAYAAYSPVNLLCHFALQDGFASGLDGYDFLGADEHWKRRWSTQTIDHSWLFLFADRPWGRLAHYAKFRLFPALKEIPLYGRLRNRLLGAQSSGEKRCSAHL